MTPITPHPFFRSPRRRIFAHRGGSALAPENTIAAFDKALALGADGLELDVRLTRDGTVVVHHDARLERTTNLTGAVADRTAVDLARADAAYFFEAAAGFPLRGSGIGVPTLADVLARYPGVPIIIELKEDRADLASRTLEVVRRADAVDRVCLGSFGLRVLRAVRAAAPEVATSAAREEVRRALYRSWCRWRTSRVEYGGYQIPEYSGITRVVSPRFIDQAHDAGLDVQVWTVDSEADARRLIEWGVNGLITDRPDILKSVIQSTVDSAAGTRP